MNFFLLLWGHARHTLQTVDHRHFPGIFLKDVTFLDSTMAAPYTDIL
jgi:hypothetical protein